MTDTRLASILADGADGAAITSDPVAASLATMEAAAVAMGVALAGAESAAAMAAKDWGCQYLNLVKVHGHDGDTLAERTRAALGWKDLKGEAGSVIKRRFNTWRSNVGVLSGRWGEVSADMQTELLGGTRSFITVYKSLIEADKAAAAKKKAEEAAKAKAEETAATTPPATAEEATPATLADMILSLTVSLDTASDDELSAVYDDMAALIAAYDKRVNAAADNQALAA
jgi:hypothetical protein